MAADCIFCKIISREIPSNIIFEDEKVVAFKDVNPQAPVHVVIIPRVHIGTLNDVKDYSVYADLFKAIQYIAAEMKIDRNGYRVIANCNRDALQSVFHIHFHLLGGRVFGWPPG
jgi:histidine triad (HIT) family protein